VRALQAGDEPAAVNDDDLRPHCRVAKWERKRRGEISRVGNARDCQDEFLSLSATNEQKAERKRLHSASSSSLRASSVKPSVMVFPATTIGLRTRAPSSASHLSSFSPSTPSASARRLGATR